MARTTPATTTRRSPLTGRAAVLALVVAALVLSSIVPLRAYFSQRADLAELRARTATQEQRVAALKAQKQKWDDPAYVEAQARSRLQFVMPGETGYVVLGPDEAPAPSAKKAVVASDKAWFSTLWGSVQAADAADSATTHAPSDAAKR
jgi:cell division protein FtsB